MRIQHNIMAMNAYRNYNTNTKALSGNLEKLSSGYKINRAGDDAAGLAISEKMRAQITGLDAAQKNVKDGISLVKTAEGAMQEIQDMLNRMDYLATQSANGTYDSAVDRDNLQKEVNALKTEINRIADSANFNGIKLLNGDQAEKTAETSTIKVSVNTVQGSVTSGQVKAGGKLASDKMDQLFVTTNGDTGLHESTKSQNQVGAKFAIDLSSVKVSGVSSNKKAVLTVNVAGTNFTIAVTSPGKTDMTGSDFTNAIGAKGVTVTIQVGGTTVAFKAAKSSDGKLEFSYANAAATVNANGKAQKINEAIFGSPVSVAVSATSAKGTTYALDAHDVHGVQNIQQAVDKEAGKMGGISFKLTDDVVSDGNVLAIGNKKFIFAVGSDTKTTAASATAAGATLVDVTSAGDDTAAAIKKAVTEIAKTATSVKDVSTGSDVAGTKFKDTGFKVSAVDGQEGVIHVDQVRKATGNALYKEANLKELFTVTQAETSARNATISMTGTAGVSDLSVSEGDQVTIAGKTYTVGAAPAGEDASKYLADKDAVAAKIQEESETALEAAAKKVLNSKDYKGKYEFALENGTLKITAKEGRKSDTVSTMNNLKDAIKREVSLTMGQLGADDIGKGGLGLQIGDTAESFNQMSVKIGDMHTNAMGAGKDAEGNPSTQTIKDIDISTQDGAKEAIATIKNAINYVSSVRGDLGAIQNRLEHTGNNLSVMAENIQDAESTIRDTDVADEMMKYVKNNILVQSAQAMLAQANQVPQGVLQLLG